MKISDLWNKYTDYNIYIIGNGPSLRLFDQDFFETALGKYSITIGLNAAWKLIDCDYNLSIHPDLLDKAYDATLITKRKDSAIKWPHSHAYWFENNKDVKDFSYLTTTCDTLYVGRGIQTGALSLAAKMGCKTAILCGCDMADLYGDHHATEQPTQFHGLPPETVYREYYLNTREVRTRLKEHFNMDTLSLSPMISAKYQEEDYFYQLKELGLDSFPVPEDISKYNRKDVDFK